MGLRVLLTSHEPLGQGASGREVFRLARGLSRWGHQVRILAADSTDQKLDAEIEAPLSVRRLICRPDDPKADLPIRLPCFVPGPDQLEFSQLSQEQWQAYENQFRQALEEEVRTFDPQVIHCQYAWIHAWLALETGLPYLVSVWGPELEAAARDGRFQSLVEQTTVGAARLLAPDPAVAHQLPSQARRNPGRVLVPPVHREDDAAYGARMAELYLSSLEAWFGA